MLKMLKKIGVTLLGIVMLWGVGGEKVQALRAGTLAERLVRAIYKVAENPQTVASESTFGINLCGEGEEGILNRETALAGYKSFMISEISPEDYFWNLLMTFNPPSQVMREDVEEVQKALQALASVIYDESRNCNTVLTSALQKEYLAFRDADDYVTQYGEEPDDPNFNLAAVMSNVENDPAYEDAKEGDGSGVKDWAEKMQQGFEEMRKKQSEMIKTAKQTQFTAQDFNPFDGKMMWEKMETPTEPLLFWEKVDNSAVMTMLEYFTTKSFCAGNLQLRPCEKVCSDYLSTKNGTFCVSKDEYGLGEVDYDFTAYLYQLDKLRAYYEGDFARTTRRSRDYDVYFNGGMVSEYTFSEANRTVVSILNRTNDKQDPKGGFLVEMERVMKHMALKECPNRALPQTSATK